MKKLIAEYKNKNNGGEERVFSDGNRFFISSNFGNGFSQPLELSKSQLETALRYTNAPQEIIQDVFKGR